MALTEDMVFPSFARPAAGTWLPSGDDISAAGLADWTDADYDYSGGYGPNRRMQWIADPLGTAIRPVYIHVVSGDRGRWGGNRAELGRWNTAKDIRPGDEIYWALSFILGDGVLPGLDYFHEPPSWRLIVQTKSPGGGQPNQGITPSNGVLYWFCNGGSQDQSQGDFAFANYERGRRHFLVVHLKFETDTSGALEVWHRLDSPPSENDTPVVQQLAIPTIYNTADSSGGYAKIGVYRNDLGDDGSYPWGVGYYGSAIRTVGVGGRSAAATKTAAFADLVSWVEGGSTPPDPDATLVGNTNVGSSLSGFTGDAKRCSTFTFAADKAIVALNAYIEGQGASGDTQAVRAVVYADDGSLIGESGALTLAEDVAAGWQRFVFSPALTLPSSGDYRLGLHTGPRAATSGEGLAYAYTSSAGALDFNLDTYADGAADPFGSASASDKLMSIYAETVDVTASGGGTDQIAAEGTLALAGDAALSIASGDVPGGAVIENRPELASCPYCGGTGLRRSAVHYHVSASGGSIVGRVQPKANGSGWEYVV